MAFVKLEKGATGRQYEGIEEVRMGSHRTKVGRTVYLTFTRDVAERAGWTTQETPSRLQVMIRVNEGVGDDAGFLLLTEDKENGYVMGAEKGKSHAFSTNLTYNRFRHYVLNDDNVNVHAVEFTVDEKDHSVLIQCPDWLRYNPQSYNEPEKPKLELTPPEAREERKPSRPTVSLKEISGIDGKGKEVPLNRAQRRKIISGVTRALG